MNRNKTRTCVSEDYRDYRPSFNASATVTMLLSYVPSKYLIGLGQIVLTNSSGLNRKRRRQKTLSRNKRVRVKKSLGLYHQQWQGTPANIEIFIDNIENNTPAIVLKVPILKNLFIGKILYHEIGHHIHRTIQPEHCEREDAADEWAIKLGRSFVKKKYWYLMPLMYLIIKSINAGKKNI